MVTAIVCALYIVCAAINVPYYDQPLNAFVIGMNVAFLWATLVNKFFDWVRP